MVKGTPSRLGLLDISPRKLERVLYFASYIITHVDDEARAGLREQMQGDYATKRERIQGEAEGKRIELSSQLTQDLGGMESAQVSTQRRIEEDYKAQREALTAEAEALRADLEDKTGDATEEDIVFRGVTLAEEGEQITEKVIDQLDELLDQELEAVEARRQRDMADAELLTDAERERKEYEVTQERERCRSGCSAKPRHAGARGEGEARADRRPEAAPILDRDLEYSTLRELAMVCSRPTRALARSAT